MINACQLGTVWGMAIVLKQAKLEKKTGTWDGLGGRHGDHPMPPLAPPIFSGHSVRSMVKSLVSTTSWLKPGACACQGQAAPSGVLSMPVCLRFPHIPTRFASGGRLTAEWSSGLASPSARRCRGESAIRHAPSQSPVGIAWPTTCRQGLPNQRSRLSRVIVPYTTASRQKRQWDRTKGDGASSPWRKPGVSAPDI